MTSSELVDRQLTDVTSAIRSLAEIMHANGLSKIDLEVGNISIRLQSSGMRKSSGGPKSIDEIPVIAPIETVDAGQTFLITAPMIGTYYTSPAPGEPQFVHIGDRIEAGQIIGIIEAMKIMNEIPADRGGVVIDVLAGNAQAVEYGSPLLRITVDEDDG
jgi:acetyl-CoA carboxylase biotin carboxyl carrier protein